MRARSHLLAVVVFLTMLVSTIGCGDNGDSPRAPIVDPNAIVPAGNPGDTSGIGPNSGQLQAVNRAQWADAINGAAAIAGIMRTYVATHSRRIPQSGSGAITNFDSFCRATGFNRAQLDTANFDPADYALTTTAEGTYRVTVTANPRTGPAGGPYILNSDRSTSGP